VLRRPTTAAACAVALLAIGATPATALTQPVDIAVLIALSTAEDAPVKAFVAEDVIVGDGPELTAEDLVPGEADEICGAVEVDIDPDAQTVTATAVGDEVGCEVALLSVGVVSDEVASFTVESDDLVTYDPSGENLLELEEAPGTVAAAWIAGEGQVLTLSGSAVFAYELVATPAPTPTPTPTPTATPSPTATPTPAPTAPAPTAPAKTPAKAAPAKPVVAQPTFTG
jgi:hypothetical protein